MTDLPRYETNRERAEKICALRHLEPETPEWLERRNDLEGAMLSAETQESERTRNIYIELQAGDDRAHRQIVRVLVGGLFLLSGALIGFGYVSGSNAEDRDRYKVALETEASARKAEKDRADSCAAREARFEERLRSSQANFDTCQKAFWPLWMDRTTACGREPPAFGVEEEK